MNNKQTDVQRNAGDPWRDEACAMLEGQKVFLDMLSRLYYAPLTEEQVESLRLSDFTYETGNDDRIQQGFGLMRSFLKNRNKAARLELNVDYTGAFYGVTEYEGRVATPYESVFRSEEGILNQQPRKEVFLEYKRYGLKREDSFNTPEDHLSFEFEFLGILADKSAEALRQGDSQKALLGIKDARSFLEEHIMTWFDALSAQALKVLETDFYRGVLLVTAGFIDLAHESLLALERDLSETKTVSHEQ